MILHNISESVIVSSEDGSQNNFKIAMNSKAFFVLSSSLYKNKIGSIVRELASNAYDSHIAANKKEIPFEIHLPDNLEPYFAVKDIGIGMSHETVLNLYTTFFASTKDQSNDAIGAFGIGSKCFYAYSDSCTITSIFNGIKTYYSAYLNEGLPTISRLQSEETTECNGVEVKIGVKREDYSKFRHEVIEQLKYFTTKPNIINGSITFEGKFNYPVLKTDNIIMVSPTNHSNASYNNIAVLGVVGYPIDDEILNQHLDRESIKFLKMIRQISLLTFNIGDIEVTASREGISYTEQTVKNLVKKIKAARTDVLEYLRTSVDTIPTAWEKAVFVNNSGALIHLYISAGYQIENATIYNDQYAFELKDILTDSKHTLVSYKFSRNGSGDTFRRDNSYHTYIVPKVNKYLFYRDIDTQPILRVREINLKDRKMDTFIIEDNNPTSDELLPEDEMVKLLTQLSIRMGGVNIVRISTLPEYKRPKVIRNKITIDGSSTEEEIDYKTPKGYVVSLRKVIGLTTISSRTADPIYDISELEGAYMLYEDRQIIKSTITKDNVTRNVDKLLDLINTFEPTNVSEVYVINSKYLKKIQKNTNLFPLEDFVTESYARFSKKAAIIQRIITLHEINEKVTDWIPRSYLQEFISDKYFHKFEKKNVAGYMVRLHKIIKSRYKNVDNIYSYRHAFPELFTDDVYQTKLYVKFMEKYEKANQRLPLLEDLRVFHVEDSKIEHMIKYFNVMGKD